MAPKWSIPRSTETEALIETPLQMTNVICDQPSSHWHTLDTLVLISHPAEGNRLSWPKLSAWVGSFLCLLGCDFLTFLHFVFIAVCTLMISVQIKIIYLLTYSMSVWCVCRPFEVLVDSHMHEVTHFCLPHLMPVLRHTTAFLHEVVPCCRNYHSCSSLHEHSLSMCCWTVRFGRSISLFFNCFVEQMLCTVSSYTD